MHTYEFTLAEVCSKTLNEHSTCVFKANKSRLEGSAEFRPLGIHEVWDIEDFVSVGSFHKSCPYFAAKAMRSNASLIFCPYNYILSPLVRSSLEKELEGAVIILDEAQYVNSALLHLTRQATSRIR
jgi:Fanconi anemia group J protein